MKALLGFAALLVVLAAVGLMLARQAKTVSAVNPGSAAGASSVPPQERIRTGIDKAMQDAAASRERSPEQ